MTVSFNQQFNNLLTPFGSFSSWSNGLNSAPDGWELVGAGATVVQDTVNVKYGLFSAALTRGGVDCRLRRLNDNMAGGTSYYRGRVFSFGAWVRAPVANSARIAIGDNSGDSYSIYHAGSNNWEFLTAVREFGAGVTNFNVSLVIENGSTTAQINGAILVEGSFVPAFERGSGDIVLPIVLQNPGSAPDDLVWLWKYLNNTYTQGEPCLVLRSNKNVLGSDLRVVINRYGGMAIWPVEGPEAKPIPRSPYDPSKINALAIDGDVVFGDHLVHHNMQALNLKRLPLALPYGTLNATLNAGVTSATVTTGGGTGLPAPGHATYRAAIWDTTQTFPPNNDHYGTDGTLDAAEIVKVTSTVNNGDGTYTLTIIRGQDNTTDVQHTVGTGKTPRITKLLDISPTGDLAVTNVLSGEDRGSGRILGGGGIGIVPLAGSSEEDGYIIIDAYGRGNTGNANCIVFRTTSNKNIANPIVTERARITSDGSIEHFVDSTKDSLVHRRHRRFNDITNASWTTVATISPSTVTNVHRRGYVKAIVSAQRDTVPGGHLRISQWYFDYAGAAPTMSPIVADTPSGTVGSIPDFRLVASGNNVLAQVQGGGVNNSDGSIILEIFCPYDSSGATWAVS